MPERLLTGWGRTAASRAEVVSVAVGDVRTAVRTAGPRGVLARGLGRSYGDAAQNAGGTVLNLVADGAIGEPDPVTGELTCPAGLDLDRLLRHVTPRGWFVPVTPGTRQVTVGGALAADVHGKNHHRDGSIASHVTRLRLVDGEGTERNLTPADDLFWAVPGGMGLTGVVTEVTLRLRPVSSAWMTVTTTRADDLDALLDALHRADEATYSVAWIDCLSRHGRGIVTSAEHAAAADLDLEPEHALRFQPRPPVPAPPWAPPNLLNRWSVATFNEAYFRSAPARPRVAPQHAASYFHPLDAVNGWNRLYGAGRRGGLVQYQFAVADLSVVTWVLGELRRRRVPIFLAVLKRFGPGNQAPLSFPAEGWTLAVDAPAAVDGLGDLLDRADERVCSAGGRLYLAKDSRMRPQLLPAMYPELSRWRELRARLDPHETFVSDLSRRLGL